MHYKDEVFLSLMCFEQFQLVYIWKAIHFSLCHNSKHLEWKIS